MGRLTELDPQEIIRYLEAGKPLPDKYRFLPFKDKRELRERDDLRLSSGASSTLNRRVAPIWLRKSTAA